MTIQGDTIFVTPDGDAGQEHELVPSLSIANLLQQREAVLTLFREALDKLEQAHTLATAARLGFSDLSMARGWRGNGLRMTGEFAIERHCWRRSKPVSMPADGPHSYTIPACARSCPHRRERKWMSRFTARTCRR